MDLNVRYLGRSGIKRSAGGLAVSLAPNLRRDRVSFVGTLKSPLRFREAVSALHDVVINDLRYHPRDKTAYEAYLAEQQKQEDEIRRSATRAKKLEMLTQNPRPIPAGLAERFHYLRSTYWKARQGYADYLWKQDKELWRMLMPCDPVITVSPDVLFFECFSADESSYGCLTVRRDAFATESDVSLGTTNVDYSWALYEEFQKLRSYRETRFSVDPAGFEVTTEDEENYREEKIDLPNSWLRGFLQLQSAMSLPMQKVPISQEGLYNVLAWLKRKKAKRSPRAIRFELEPGKPVQIVMEPWEKRILLHSAIYQGTEKETIRTWGRDRLMVLSRLLPLIEEVNVHLLGTGLPSFWVVRMGEMRLTLGLSGWTTNDWTGGSAIDQILPPMKPDKEILGTIARAFRDTPSRTFAQVHQQVMEPEPIVASGLNELALMGQLIHDLPANVYRWRQIMPVEVSLASITPDNPETLEAVRLAPTVKIHHDSLDLKGRRTIRGRAGREVELVLDADGRILDGKCNCSHHFQFRLRKGPCAHLQALRNVALCGESQSSLGEWFKQLWTRRN